MMPDENVKTYTRGTVFIFDYFSIDATETSQSATDADHFHAQCCDRIDKFFSNSSEYEVKRVNFSRFTPKQFLNWWKDVLASKSSDELVIVYYQGKAIGHLDHFTL